MKSKNVGTKKWIHTFSQEKYIWIMVSLPLLYFLIFHYVPLLGLTMAFQEYNPSLSVFEREFVGFKYFIDFFNSPDFGRLITNTFLLSFLTLIFGFPAPIIIALLINDCVFTRYKKVVQTVSYMPNFISTVVIVGMLVNFLNPTDGIVNIIIRMFGGTPKNFLGMSEWFRPIYVISNIWQFAGWTSIIYLSALSSIDPQMYEAAVIDGANKVKLLFKITLPQLIPTIIIMFILRMGSLMSIGFEKIILMYNPGIYDTADVISTYVYRRGILESNFGLGTAVGIFNSIINTSMLLVFNKISSKISETSLW